jgi:hypothetical protein
MLTEKRINELLSVEKILPDNLSSIIRLNPKYGNNQKDFKIEAVDGCKFEIKLRQSKINLFDFSVILLYDEGKTNSLFTLRRYNGNTHKHKNEIEKNWIEFKFHIHMATERYQLLGGSEVGYAEESNVYSDFQSAFNLLKRECGFTNDNDNEQMDLWSAPTH